MIWGCFIISDYLDLGWFVLGMIMIMIIINNNKNYISHSGSVLTTEYHKSHIAPNPVIVFLVYSLKPQKNNMFNGSLQVLWHLYRHFILELILFNEWGPFWSVGGSLCPLTLVYLVVATINILNVHFSMAIQIIFLVTKVVALIVTVMRRMVAIVLNGLERPAFHCTDLGVVLIGMVFFRMVLCKLCHFEKMKNSQVGCKIFCVEDLSTTKCWSCCNGNKDLFLINMKFVSFCKRCTNFYFISICER